MIHAFDAYELDTLTGELRADGRAAPLEPQVFALLRLLVENPGRLITRDEIIERIWAGRIVSDSAVTSRVKSARRAIGDNGTDQRLIRTIHGRGLRFLGEVASRAAAIPVEEVGPSDPAAPSRPSIAVLPFERVGDAGAWGAIAEGLPHDLIVELSRLRWLFVIARGSAFQFRGEAAIGEVRAALGVRYCLCGVVEVAGPRMLVRVELCDTGDAGVVWSESYRAEIDAVHEIRAAIVQAVVVALELHIPLAEARRALRSPRNLDAWSAYHLGLRHLFRFDREGNDQAAALFEQAIAREPGFARAYAGLSFTHFESAFLRFAEDGPRAADQARRYAVLGLDNDPLDPFCNLVMGRVSWLHGDLEASLPWLGRAVELNPNYAQGQYSLAWTRTLLGQGAEGRSLADAALALSPLDPLLYGMLGVRALSHMVLDEPAEAARWAERAARAPRAHALIELIAAVAHRLDGEPARAETWARSALTRHPGLSADDFLGAFPFRQSAMRQTVAGALRALGL